MRMFVKILLVMSGVLFVGCGGGGSDSTNERDTSNEYVYKLKYKGLKSSVPILTKVNIPIYLDALDISGIRNFVQIYVQLPYAEILESGKDISETINGSIGGNQIIDIHIVNSSIIELTHTFNNYMDENGTVDGIIKDTVSYVDGNAEHTIIVDNLEANYLDIHTVVEGVLTYSWQIGLVTKKFLIENKTLNETLLYENFIADDRNGNPVLYSGKICYSDEGCVELSTTYNQNAANSDVMTIKGENNTAVVNKDYTQDFLVDVSIPNISDMHTYLVYDSNITGNHIPLYEANISKEAHTFFDEQKLLEERSHPIKLIDLNNDGKNELIFLTEIYTREECIEDAENPGNCDEQIAMQQYDFNDKYIHVLNSFKLNDILNCESYIIINKGYDDTFSIIDSNGDGLKDIFFPKYYSDGLLVQKADKSFSEKMLNSINNSGTGVSAHRNFISDFNGDGKDDRVKLYGCSLEILTDIENDNTKIKFPLTGCSNFNGEAYTHNGIQLKIADFNKDGKKDFLIIYKDKRDPIINGNDSYFIVINKGNGAIEELPSLKIIDEGEILTETRFFAIGAGIIVGDINKDGYDDFVINSHLFLNKKDNTFKQGKNLSTNGSFGGEEYLGMYDVNKDGINDIVFSGYLGIRAVLIFKDSLSRDILLSADGDQRIAKNLTIGNLDKDGIFDIVRNYNNRIEFISFK